VLGPQDLRRIAELVGILTPFARDPYHVGRKQLLLTNCRSHTLTVLSYPTTRTHLAPTTMKGRRRRKRRKRRRQGKRN
jgi:hypothetical protein